MPSWGIGGALSAEGGMTKLSIRGAGIMGRPGIAANLFNCLSQQGINLRLIATSEVKVSCVIASAMGHKALQAVQEAFDVSDSQVQLNPLLEGENEPEVRGVALDRDQAQLSVCHVPDRPGTAAALCSALADEHQPRRHRAIGTAARRRLPRHQLHPAQGIALRADVLE